MTFEYSQFADMMVVSISEPISACVYIESQTHGVILRVEEASGIIRGFEVLLWSRRIANGMIDIPEIADPDFHMQWAKNLASM